MSEESTEKAGQSKAKPSEAELDKMHTADAQADAAEQETKAERKEYKPAGPGLYRLGKTYWGRVQVNGKRIFRSLKTKNKADAKFLLEQERQRLAKPAPPQPAERTVGEYAQKLKAQYASDVSVGQREKDYVTERLRCLENTWDGIMKKPVTNVTEQGVRDWVAELTHSRYSGNLRSRRLK